MPYLARQGAGRLKLNKATLESIPIAVPSMEVQAQIVKILDHLDLGLLAARIHLETQRDLSTHLLATSLEARTLCSLNPTPSSR